MRLFFIFGLIFFFNSVIADQYWSTANLNARDSNNVKIFQLDVEAFKTALSPLNSQSSVTISLPRIDGMVEQFRVSRTHVVAAELAVKFPELKTYKIQHLTSPEIRGRMEVMQNKVSVMIKTPHGQELIDLMEGSSQIYHSKEKRASSGQSFSCGTGMSHRLKPFSMKFPSNNQYRAPINQLTKLKVAIGTTIEYSAKFGSTKPLVLAEIIKAVNRINEVYESDLAITLELVSNNDNVIFIGSDSFSNTNASALINESQTVLDAQIGSANYDLGHVFSTGAGGLAFVRSVCSASSKAKGITGLANPTGDSFWIDYVAHEMGHQLGAEHTFNGTTGSCSSGRHDVTAYEPGSGSTLMGYANICGAENLQSSSDASFHSKSIEQIVNAIPNSCGIEVSYGSVHSGDSNANVPTANAGADYVIPINTPFVLTANSTDADGDIPLYQWDGIDAGTSTSSATIGQDLNTNALFRSNLPQTYKKRYFPSIKTLLSGTSDIGITLPTTNRANDIRLKVIDSKGGYGKDDLVLTSNTGFNGFAVTSQNTASSLNANNVVTVTWNNANTTSAPINCATVDIQLLAISADNSTFTSRDLVSGVANNGSYFVTLPDENSVKSRFLVKCGTNVFFDINDADFSIAGSTTNTTADNDDYSSSSGDQSKFTSNTVQVVTSGGGSLSYWMFLLLSLGLFLTRRRA